jgi:hypothetical protein
MMRRSRHRFVWLWALAIVGFIWILDLPKSTLKISALPGQPELTANSTPIADLNGESDGLVKPFARIHQGDQVREQETWLKRLRDRELDAAVVIESAPYPKMVNHIVAVPTPPLDLVQEVRRQSASWLERDSDTGSDIEEFLEFRPKDLSKVAALSPTGPCKWRIIWLSLYGDALDKYRFRVIDSNLSPEEVFSYFPNGLLAASQGVDTRMADITLEEARVRYGHLFTIEEPDGADFSAIDSILPRLRSKERGLGESVREKSESTKSKEREGS